MKHLVRSNYSQMYRIKSGRKMEKTTKASECSTDSVHLSPSLCLCHFIIEGPKPRAAGLLLQHHEELWLQAQWKALQALYIHSLQRQHLLGCITHRKPWPVLLPSEIQPREPQPRQLHEEPPPRRPQREEDVAIGAPCGWTQGAESKTLMPSKLRFCTSSEAGTWPMYPWHLVSA